MANFEVSQNFNPADDFDNFVNHHWKVNNPIPDEYSSWGSFQVLNRENETKLRNICIEGLNKEKNEIDQNQKNLNILWKQGNNETTISNDNNISSMLEKYLLKIDEIKDKNSLMDCFKLFLNDGIPIPFDISVSADFKNTNF